MPRPEECLFTKEHEWLHIEGDVARVGITDFAQNELGGIVYVNMGEVGRTVTAGGEMGEIESVKAVAEVYAPVDGEVVEINAGLADAPEQVNTDPMGNGWLVRLRLSNPGQTGDLMDWAGYQKFLEQH